MLRNDRVGVTIVFKFDLENYAAHIKNKYETCTLVG